MSLFLSYAYHGKQVKRLHVAVPNLSEDFAKNLGQALQPCSHLNDIHVAVGTANAILEDNSKALRLESVSGPMHILLSEMNVDIFKEVITLIR